MIETDKIDNIETGGENTGAELIELKKEMVGHVVDKMKEKKQNDMFLNIGEDLVVDYLLDEGESVDKINDFFIGIGINLFSSSADQLKDLREKIKNSSTKEELETLEKSVIDNLDNQSDTSTSSRSSTSTRTTVGTTTTSSAARRTSRRRTSSTSETESVVESAKVGEAKEVPLKDRMRRLFPKGAPKEESEMKKYLTKIKVPIRTSDGKDKKLTLHIHKKLANEYAAIFQEMYDKGIPVNPEKTGGYNWRKMRKGNKMSHHSYGSAVDVNWDVNGGVYGKTDKNSPYYNDQDTVAIWKNHGFYWGGDWSAKSDDPMHFSYMNA